MRNPNDIAVDLATTDTLLDITGAFEGLASMHIAKIKNKVVASQQFFAELWQIYDQIRVDELFRFGREENENVIDKELVIAITAEGNFSGDIDKKLVDTLAKDYDRNLQDVVVIGHHGAIQLARVGISFKRYFKLPESDENINVRPLINITRQYRSATVYYQSYNSLLSQDVKRVNLHDAVTIASQDVAAASDVIDEATYIFEPDSFAVIAHLERSMMQITLSQTIFESKLAQNASRFRAMSAARDRSRDARDDFRLEYNRVRRAQSDERLKEIVNGIKLSTGGISL